MCVGCSAFSAASIITKDVLKIARAYDLFSSKTYTYIWGYPYLLTFPKNTCFFFFFLLFICVGWSTFSPASIITKDVLKTASVYDLSNSKRNELDSEMYVLVWFTVYHISFMVDPLSYFSFQPVLHDWCNKGRGMCYPVFGMMHIKEPLLLIGKSSLCGGSRFPLSLSEWSFTICLTPYNRK